MAILRGSRLGFAAGRRRASSSGPAWPRATASRCPTPPARAGTAPLVAGAPARPPAADERTREQRRFGRADRDNDGRVTLEELTYGRRRAFARLDTDHNGQLSFEELAARLLQRFASADANHDRALNRAEFAATAPRSAERPRPRGRAAIAALTIPPGTSRGGGPCAGWWRGKGTTRKRRRPESQRRPPAVRSAGCLARSLDIG